MKKLKYLLFTFIFLAFGPIVALADEVTIKVVPNPTNVSNVIFSMTGEKNVTTIADIKEALTNAGYNLNDYLILDSWNEPANDSQIVCDEGLSCYYDETNGDFTYIYFLPVDHTEKKYTLNTIPATNENMFESLYQTNYEVFGSLAFMSCDNTFTKCTFIDYGTYEVFDNIRITYKYDKEIAKIAQKAVDDGLLNKTSFVTTDTELLHYLNFGGSLIGYTSEFKNQLSNLNFTFEMDQRGGGFDPFEDSAIGFYKFMYDGTLYAVKDFMSITAPHVIYVPTDTTNIKKAIEDRLNDIFGKDLHLSVKESTKTINQLLDEYGENPIAGGDEHYYILTNTDPNSWRYDEEFYFISKKDSSKINNTIAFKSSDLLTNVSVEADGNVPLDTLVGVEHITSGSSYDKIIKALDIAEGEVFDIELFSIAQNKNITKLDNGKFLVSIPIPDKYEGKDLIVYYVDSKNKVTEYKVTVKNGFATFETDHFSTYTLAINDKDNPQTGDDIALYASLLGLSVVGIAAVVYSKKKKTN